MNSTALSHKSEAQTYTLSVDFCQNRELMELLEIQAAHRQQKQAGPGRQHAMRAFMPTESLPRSALAHELPKAGNLSLWLAAACAVLLAVTGLALWSV